MHLHVQFEYARHSVQPHKLNMRLQCSTHRESMRRFESTILDLAQGMNRLGLYAYAFPGTEAQNSLGISLELIQGMTHVRGFDLMGMRIVEEIDNLVYGQKLSRGMTNQKQNDCLVELLSIFGDLDETIGNFDFGIETRERTLANNLGLHYLSLRFQPLTDGIQEFVLVSALTEELIRPNPSQGSQAGGIEGVEPSLHLLHIPE